MKWKIIMSLFIITCLAGGIYSFLDFRTKAASDKVKITEKKEEKKQETHEFSKEELYEKITNAVDYFQTVQGSYIEETKGYARKDEYKLRLGDRAASYVKSFTKVPQTDQWGREHVISASDGNLITMSVQDKKYWEQKYEQIEKQSPQEIKKRITEARKKEPYVAIARRIDIPFAANGIFQADAYANFFRDFSKWNIVNQHEMYKGNDTIVVRGEFTGANAKKFQAKTFHYWFDRNTGLVLKYENRNEQGEVVGYLETESFVVNAPIKDGEFAVDIPSDYQKDKH